MVWPYDLGKFGSWIFEVRFYENAPNERFDIIYGPGMVNLNNGSNSTVGVQRDIGSLSTEYVCSTNNGGVLTSGLALIFLRGPCLNSTPTPTPTLGPIVSPGPGGGGPEPLPTASPTSTPEPSESCRQWIRDDGPQTFSSDGTIELELEIPLDGVIDTISVSNLSITKEGAGKLNGYLVSPDGVQVELFHSVCRNRDSDEPFRWLNISLSDEGEMPIQSIYCQNVVRGGIFRPDSPSSSDDGILGKLRGSIAAGTWKLVLKGDVQALDSVRLESWGLNICATGTTMPANRAISGTQDSNLALLLAITVVTAALATVGAPLAWSRARGVMFVDDGR